MNKNSIFFAAAFGLCAFAQAEVITITEGSSSGYTMADGNTYVIQNSACFSNSVAGGNGMAVDDGATVVIYIPTNVTLTAIGADSDGQIGGGAGIYVPSNATLVVTGEGTLYARGGNAGNGGDGEDGKDGKSGYGGNGGNGGIGGGGSGSAIGGNGGAGGIGGSGGGGQYSESTRGAGVGNDGSKGETSFSCGSLYLLGCLKIFASQGGSGVGGSAGHIGAMTQKASSSSQFGMFGGGGGGGGGAGASATYAIGAGGRSGGGGGGGGGGGASHTSSYYISFPNSEAWGGGGEGGKSEISSGTNGSAKGNVLALYLNPGDGGVGGDYGDNGDDGELFKSSAVTLETSRIVEVAETHSAVQHVISASPNGGVFAEATSQIIATLGVQMPSCTFPTPLRTGFKFTGWASAPTDGTMYYDAEGNPLLSCYPTAASITLYAQWENLLENPNHELVSGDDYAWQTTIDETLPGGYELCSAPIPDGTNSWMKTIVTGPGKLSFDWKVSCENRYAYLQVLIDGVQQKRITGAKDWASLLYEIGDGEHEIVWNYVKDGASAVGEDAGFVRNISWRPYLSFSSSTAHGTASPADNDSLLYGDAVEASVDASVTDGDVRYDCIGWAGMGSAPASGGSNTCAFVIREDSLLAWLWRTNYWTSLTVAGPATADFSEGWLEAGAGISVAVAPSVPFFSIALSGDTEGVALDGTNIVFSATAPRAIVATVIEHTYADALDTTGLSWRTGGDAVWIPQGTVASDGEDAVQSGALDAKGTSWIETVVIGPGTISFKWRFEAGNANSGIDFLVDGDYEDGLTDTTGGWESGSCAIGEGRHVLRWEFYGSNGDGNGAAWLDAVSWDGGYPIATSTTPDPVPYAWLDAEAKSFVTSHYGDYEAAAFEMSANGRDTVWECYVAGISPTNAAAAFRAVISWENGAPEISWEPILTPEEAAKRTYRKFGKKSLTDPNEDWTEINGDEASYNFFKVSVEMTK